MRTAQALQLGVEHHRAGRLAEAEQIYRRILKAEPGNPDALYLLGVVAHQVGDHESAVQLIEEAIRLGQSNPHSHYDLGEAYRALRRPEEALASYDKALAIQPDFAKAANNRGVALDELRRHEEALASYDRALAIRPAYAEALDNRGLALYDLTRYADALACYDKALAIKPDLAQALWHRGNALNELKRHEEALASHKQALAIRPDYAEAHASSIYLRQHLCEWAGLSHDFELLRERLAHGKSGDISPFTLLAVPGIQPGEQLSCARRFAEEACGAALSRPPLCKSTERQDGPRLRIGYLSADFREHPVSMLVAQIIELHDRNRIEVFGYSYGVDDQSALRRRLQGAFDTFRDVATLSDAAAAQLILEDRVQILVDLTGHTRNSRPAITALRPAPVQAGWLGYPGTLGHARLADYIIGDAIVSPPANSAHFSEKPALMPHCFQPNDRRRAIGDKPTRASVGLPPQGFVFCCFNQSYKLNPPMFDIWCRLLAAVSGSVLWLLGESAAVQRNLRQEAQERGITQDRLIFAPRIGPAQNLARLQVADLFLDTLPFNAGATGSDALWAGVPLVTCIGETFAGRYAASLLHAAGVPELITDSLRAYEALSLKLATDADYLAEVRAKLAANRPTCALFDSAQFTRDLEGLFHTMWTDHRGSSSLST